MDIFNKENKAMTEEELLGISGGAGARSSARMGTRGSTKSGSIKSNVMRIACCNCGNPFYADVNKSECMCPVCGVTNTFHG